MKTKLSPQEIQDKFQQAVAIHQQDNLEEAKAKYEEILTEQPEHFYTIHMLGVLYGQLKNYHLAIELISKAIEIYPKRSSFYFNLAKILTDIKDYPKAIINFEKAINLEPDFSEAYYGLGNVFYGLKDYPEAIRNYDKAINLKPDFSEAYHCLGNVFYELKDYSKAIINFEKAINLKPDFSEAYYGLGNVFYGLKDYPEAIRNYDKAINLKPDYVAPHFNLGIIFFRFKGFSYAIKKLEKVLSIDPNYIFTLGTLIHCKMNICNWNDFQSNILELTQKIEDNQKVSPPFFVHSTINSLAIVKKATISFSDESPVNLSLGAITKYPKSDKIRIGYFSSDFYNHAVSILLAEVFELHDKNQFEIIAFAFGPDIKDQVYRRVSVAFDKFIDVRAKSDKEVAKLAREMQIDIAIDLNGYTDNNRTSIFAFGAAPIQLSYIGFLGTMATSYHQYIIADQTLIPPESQNHYSEKIIYLPSYQANDSKRQISSKIFTKKELNLPEEGFVYCCFNASYKILPATFDCWMRILKAVPKSVFLLFCDSEIGRENLKKEVEKREINLDRIIFAQRLNTEEYLSRYRVADLFLDTFPYNAGTTASDALWAGLPVLTYMGEIFPSRIAASLLSAIEMPELITTSQAQYESLAIELGNNPDKIKELKNKLNKNRLTTQLFNSKLFTKNLETAYKKIYRRYHDDLPPDHIYI